MANASWNDQVFVSLDLETTGLNSEKDSIIEVGLVKFCFNKEISRYSSLVYFDGNLDREIIELTGISEEELLLAPKLNDVLDEIRKFIGENDIIVGHNVGFDLSFLAKQNIKFSDDRILDSWYLATSLLSDLNSYSLQSLAIYMNWEYNAHRALDDAVAAGELVKYLFDKLKSISDKCLSMIETINSKSDWKYSKFFQFEIERRKSEKYQIAKKIKIKPDYFVDSNEISLNFDEYDNKFVFLENKMNDFLKNSVDNGLGSLLIVNSNLWNFLREKNFKGIFIDRQEKYLCREKLSKVLIKDQFESEEAAILTRIFIKIDNGQWDGYLNDLNLSWQEYNAMEKWQCNGEKYNHKNCFFAQKKQLINSKKFLTVSTILGLTQLDKNDFNNVFYWSNCLLFEDSLLRDGKVKLSEKDCVGILEEIGAMEEIGGKRKQFSDKLEKIGKEMAMLWGILGLRIKSKGIKQEYGLREDITPIVLEDNSFVYIKKSAQKLLTSLTELKELSSLNSFAKIYYLEQFLLSLFGEGAHAASLFLNTSDLIMMELLPKELKNISESWMELSKNKVVVGGRYFGTRKILDEFAGINSYKYIANQTNFEKRIVIGKKLIDNISNSGLNLIIFSSRAKISDFLKMNKNQLILEGAIDFSNKKGRIWQERFPKEANIFVGWYDLPDLLLRKEQFDKILVDSLPFDIPNDFVLNIRSMEYGDNNFEYYFLPRMLGKIESLFSLIKDDGGLYIFDERVLKKSYGKNVLKLSQDVLYE